MSSAEETSRVSGSPPRSGARGTLIPPGSLTRSSSAQTPGDSLPISQSNWMLPFMFVTELKAWLSPPPPPDLRLCTLRLEAKSKLPIQPFMATRATNPWLCFVNTTSKLHCWLPGEKEYLVTVQPDVNADPMFLAALTAASWVPAARAASAVEPCKPDWAYTGESISSKRFLRNGLASTLADSAGP